MTIEVRLPQRIDLDGALRVYDESLDDIRSILSDVCQALHSQGELIISGFGDPRWRVDVGTDLLVMLEQLPTAIRNISSGEYAEIELYEQGAERALEFTPAAGCYLVSCRSWGKWQPDPGTERIERAELVAMLTAVQDRFMTVVRNSAPQLAEHPWVVSWLRG